LTASHNPGGPNADFGIKYNLSNGAPAPESITDLIYNISKSLKSYESIEIPKIDITTIKKHSFDNFEIEIFNGIEDYVQLMKQIFDFESIKPFLKSTPTFTVLFDSMHAGWFKIIILVTGPYATGILIEELGLPAISVINYIPKLDFANGHPDPNLTVTFIINYSMRMNL
jgi:phosphoglucomutase